MAEIVVLTAHPRLEHSRVNQALLQAAQALPAGRVQVRDLYALYPDYLIDIAAERAALAEARLVVWQFPFHWYSVPPLLKLWLDEVFGFGWAYGMGGAALEGKDLWLVVSTGGVEAAYHPAGQNQHFIDDFWPPMAQTARVAGMRFLPPLVLHGAHHATDEEVAAHAAVYAERLAAWPAWPEIEELPECIACEVPSDARPLLAEERP